ncbi:MAG: fused MFS/spermidine synthase, partial [Gammaproteobacteria bacterium]
MLINLKKASLPCVVFVTGACILIIEVVATRILAPYFGNTIFTISSVIGIVLAALSVGYYLGGRLADKQASERAFYTIILASGVSVVVLQILSLTVLPVLSHHLSLINGPLLTASILFFVPAVLLGMLSPYAIKLQAMRVNNIGIGSVTGSIFFWSTLGSIFGSLFAGFVLIPRLGIDAIMLGVAITLGLIGIVPLVRGSATRPLLGLFLLVTGIIIIGNLFSVSHKGIVYERDGIYQKITIYDGKQNGRPIRFFKQDRSDSGAMYLDSDELVLDYTKYYSLYKLFSVDPNQVLVIGGGIYSIPKAFLKDLPDVRVDVTEIEPSLQQLAVKYFNLRKTERLKTYTQDGRRFLYDTNKTYDVIFSDVYHSLYSIPAHFTTVEFFQLARKKLSPNGIFIMNIIGALSRKTPSLALSEIKTFQKIFPNSYIFAVKSPDRIGPQNIILAGYNSDRVIDLTDSKITQHQDAFIQGLAAHQVDMNRFELSAYSILTDKYAPVDYLTAKLIERYFTHPRFPDGEEMMAVIEQLLRYGHRYLHSQGHKNVVNLIRAEMQVYTGEVIEQTWQHRDANGNSDKLTNIIGRMNPGLQPRIILATHYDSKRLADKDRENPTAPVPGANDSASGVAALFEMARVITNMPKKPRVGIDFVFFDGEEGETTLGSDYRRWRPLGSMHFAREIQYLYPGSKPDA